jgi:serine phosphatase RsbU (regulator of sigma subunit)
MQSFTKTYSVFFSLPDTIRPEVPAASIGKAVPPKMATLRESSHVKNPAQAIVHLNWIEIQNQTLNYFVSGVQISILKQNSLIIQVTT